MACQQDQQKQRKQRREQWKKLLACRVDFAYLLFPGQTQGFTPQAIADVAAVCFSKCNDAATCVAVRVAVLNEAVCAARLQGKLLTEAGQKKLLECGVDFTFLFQRCQGQGCTESAYEDILAVCFAKYFDADIREAPCAALLNDVLRTAKAQNKPITEVAATKFLTCEGNRISMMDAVTICIVSEIGHDDRLAFTAKVDELFGKDAKNMQAKFHKSFRHMFGHWPGAFSSERQDRKPALEQEKFFLEITKTVSGDEANEACTALPDPQLRVKGITKTVDRDEPHGVEIWRHQKFLCETCSKKRWGDVEDDCEACTALLDPQLRVKGITKTIERDESHGAEVWRHQKFLCETCSKKRWGDVEDDCEACTALLDPQLRVKGIGTGRCSTRG